MPEPSKKNPFPWLPFWPEVEENPLKLVLAIIVLALPPRFPHLIHNFR
jgi:hypothetical protein